MDLQPRRGDDKVAIPVTFDQRYTLSPFKMSKIWISCAFLVLFFALWVVVMIIAQKGTNYRFIMTIISFIVVPSACRYLIIGESKYRKNYKNLVASNFQYDYTLFWSIYDTTTGEPTVFLHNTGIASVFVAFDKDVVVGKGEESDYDHFEAITSAYQLLAKKGISCTHIDYMDNVGKDTRLEPLFAQAQECRSEDLRDCIISMLDYMQWYMMGTYADYDVYCFTSKMRPDLLIDELTPVISAFESANYIRYRILTRPQVRDLVASVFSVPDFSVTRTCDSLFSSQSARSYLKVIWTETDGKREIINKTRAQIAASQRIQASEREAVKANRKHAKNVSNATIDLFDTPDVEEPDVDVEEPVVDVEVPNLSPFGKQAPGKTSSHDNGVIDVTGTFPETKTEGISDEAAKLSDEEFNIFDSADSVDDSASDAGFNLWE